MQELGEFLSSIDYAGVATLDIIYPREAVTDLPPGAGFVVPAIDHRYLLACTFSSQKYGKRCPEDHVLLRAFVGGALHQSDLDCDDDMMVSNVHEELKWRFGITSQPVNYSVSRWPLAMAQHTIGHETRLRQIRDIEMSLPGLALVGNGYEGVGIPDIIAQSNKAVDRLQT